MKRFLTSLAIALLAITTAPLQALAATNATTGAWTWTDVSDYVGNRTNRPIWAMTHANSGWFYTDGQNLWNGGQVYRFDGSTNVTVTNEVRNAGLDRVDDIVSDGADTILFLQDIVRLDNQFRIVVNKNGTYYNATDIVRGMLRSDEGISSISGRNGTWHFVTTESRLFRWYANSSSPVEITVPYRIREYSYPSEQSMIYSVGQVSFRGMKMVPITGSDWMLMSNSQGNWLTYKYDGSTFTDITSTVFPNTRGTDILVSNGNTAVFGQGSYSYQNGTLAQYNGSSVYQTSIGSSIFSASIAAAAWDGTSWILISSNKEIARMLPNASNIESIGQSRDYFITAAGDTNGHLLLGGTVSQIGITGPSSPLTAKLVMITENGATNITNTGNSNNATVDTDSGINKWEWIDPNTALSSFAQTAYHVGSWDADGIKRVEIYVNGAVKRTCDLGNAKGNTDCSMNIYGSDYSIGSNIFANAKITDAKDKTTWTSGLTIYRTDSNTNTTNNTGSTSDANSNIWTWIDPNKTSFYSDESVTFYAGAWDKDGINQVIISVNGNDVRTCTLSGTTKDTQCAYTLYANSYLANSTITLRARIVDVNNSTVWSDQKSIYRNSSTSSGNSDSNGNSNIWTWVEPNKTTLYADEKVTFSAGGRDNDGINRIILTVNGTDRRTCTYSGTTGNVECSYEIDGNSYASNSTIALRARIIDVNGNTSWSNVQELYRYSGNSNNNSNSGNSNASIWTWIEGNMTSLNANESAIFKAGAWDGDGVNRIILSVNGNDKKTCNFGSSKDNVECAYTVSASDYSANTNLVLRARVIDTSGSTVWSTERDIYRNANTSTGNNSNTDSSTGAISFWEWLEPSNTNLEIQKTAAYHADAWSASAIKSIVVYVNGSASKTCTFTRSVDNRDCLVSVVGRNYAQGSSIFMNALVTDYDGKQTWTTGKTVNIVADSTSSQNNNPNGWVNAITNRENGFTVGQSITVSVSSDDTDGVSRTEIYINGVRNTVCNNSKTCTATVMPPSTGNYFNYAGTMVDKKGAIVTTGYKQIIKK